ncbi:MAG: TonB-dependent receptor [Gammaproteobacteria bacterium]|nr:TonB-dependent receptor [Gammaproteobacteria bacterium]
MTRFINLRALIAAMLGFAMPFAASAQLEEIVVTASKRSATLQEIPIAVSVTPADVIEKAEIKDLADLQSVVPSLKVNTLQNSTNTNFSIRGFGNGANNPGIEPSVGVFIDGVYRSRSASQITDLPNLERVEVLRGPQSTLFGKNASAGVISIVTAEPTGEAAGRISFTAGNFNQKIVRLQGEGSLGDNTAFAVSANSNTRDGYFKNLETGSDINNRNRQAVRGQLVWNGDVSKVRLIADYDQIDEECCGVINLFQSPLEVFVNSQTGARVIPNDQQALSAFQNTDPVNRIDNGGLSLQWDRDYDNFTLTSISSYRTTDSFSSIDADFSTGDYIRNDITTEIDTLTQEIRLTSNGGGDVDWMVGGFYFNESIDYINDLPYGNDFRGFVDALAFASGAPQNILAGLEIQFGLPPFRAFFPNSGAITEVADLENDAYSFFGSFDWHMTDRLTATLGLNYTKDEKEAQVRQVNRDLFSSLDFVQIGGGLIFQQLVGAGVPPAVAAGQAAALSTTAANPLLGLQAIQFLPPFQDFPNPVEDGKSDDDELTYNFRLAYDVNDSVNIYGGISTGFKATSWNLSRDAKPTAADLGRLQALGIAQPNLVTGTRFADPEEATSVELGLKARFDKGALNLAIFDQEIKGFQSNIFGGTGFNLANAGKQSTKGVEFDLTYYPSESLQLTLAGTFLDAKYDDFDNASVADFIPGVGLVQGVGGLSGEMVNGVPEVALAASATYDFMMGNLDSYFRADYQYDEEVQTNDNIPAQFSSISFKNLNLSLGMTTENGLSFTLWGRNVTDHDTVTTGFPTVGGTRGIFGYRNQPRTYGVTITKDF